MGSNEAQYTNVPKSSRVFISYSHDSPEHKRCVLRLSNLLRREGVDCNIDQYETSPQEGWFRWMVNQIEEADFVLIICTENYEKRFKGKDEVGKGRGAKWEGAIITQDLYYSEANNKCIPIVFSPADSEYIPSILKSATYYELNKEIINDGAYDELYARLTYQKLILKPDLGKLRYITPMYSLSATIQWSVVGTQDKETKLDESKTKPVIGKLRKIRSSDNLLKYEFPEQLATKYNSIEYIGRGGFAKIFKAKTQDEKLVAVKIPISSDNAIEESFIRKLDKWATLEHNNIVKINCFNALPIPHCEMELCDCALSDKQFPLDINYSVWIIFNICEGLKYAHARSIVHLDIKPENILIKEGRPKISDWELSEVLTSSEISSGGYTLLYAAPEQISKKFGKRDARTDIWQIGVIFYQIITGKMPFEGNNPVMIMSSITMKELEPPSFLNPNAERLDPIIMKCLEINQEKRYQSILEIQCDLLKMLQFFPYTNVQT